MDNELFPENEIAEAAREFEERVLVDNFDLGASSDLLEDVHALLTDMHYLLYLIKSLRHETFEQQNLLRKIRESNSNG